MDLNELVEAALDVFERGMAQVLVPPSKGKK
jgi:hypothetical protein